MMEGRNEMRFTTKPCVEGYFCLKKVFLIDATPSCTIEIESKSSAKRSCICNHNVIVAAIRKKEEMKAMKLGNMKSNTLVCDIGGGSIKVGIAGKLSPDDVVPCLTGCPKYSIRKKSASEPELLVGNDALEKGKV